MEPEVLSRIIQALDIIHSPFASNEIRLEANQYCNSIKDHPNAPIFGHFLALKENGQSDIVRHFGLQLLENTIRYKWIDGIYSDSEREQIKQAIISLVQRGTHDILIEKQFIKEKVAKLFADVARREWPIRWTDMNNLLRNLYTSSPTTQELTLLIFQYLGKESDLRDSLTCIITSYNILREKYPDGVKKDNPSSCKDEIIIIMQGEQDSEGWLMLWVKSLEKLVKLQSASSVIYEKLIIVTLNTIATYAEWIIARSIAETNALLVSCKSLLSDCHEIRMVAIECITAIVSRTFQTPEDRTLVFDPICEQDGMELLFLSFKMIQPSQDLLLEENDYTYLKKYVEAIVEFGEKHICFKNNTVIPKQFPKLFDIFGIDIRDLKASIKFHSLCGNNVLAVSNSSSTHLKELFAERLRILFHKDDDDNKTTHYIDVDFDSKNEYKNFAMTFRTRLGETIKLITQMRPIESFNWIVNRIQKTLNISPSEEDLDGKLSCNVSISVRDGVCKVDSSVYFIFDAELTLMDSIVIGIGKLIKSNEGHDTNYAKIMNGMNDFLQMLLNLNYPDVIMSNRYLASMLSFVDMLNRDSRLLFQVLQKIFQFAIFRPPGFIISSASSFPQPVYRLRCGAIAVLIKFGTSMPDVLMNIYNDISGYVNNIFNAESKMVTRKEKVSFKKFLLCIIYYSKIPLEQKRALFDPIVLPVMNKWLSPDITCFITSITQFRDASGLNFLSSIIINMKQKGIYKLSSEISKEFHETIAKYELARYNLSFLTETVITFFVKASEGASKGISNSEYSGLWEQYIPTILSATLALIRIIHQLWNVESWQEYPEEFKEVLRLSKEDKASIVGQTLNIPTTISNRKSYTIAIVRPYVLKCPAPEVLSGFFPQLLKYLDKKLTLEWRIMVEKGIQISTPEMAQLLQDNLDTNSDISDEILNEQVLRDLTRAYVDIFDQIFSPVPKKQATDTVSCTRTAQLCARILPNLIKHEGLREFVGTSLLTAALQALHDGYHKESHPVIISFITDLYTDLRPLSSAPYETFAQLPNMDHVQLQKFETSLSQATESKFRKKIVKEFLEGITGLSTEEWFKMPDTAPVSSTRRTVSGVYSKPVIGVLDVVEDPYDVGIVDLFD
ncbi:24136_t:CDS:10 [Dentiscutata erythropus]|uniref:24136_t:CDS:1 n=1 Tax=Dentiscutata erythropus TaxID=1348616 RepID=A0A9N8WHN7_9GLOM|nr:24136_t:CDS:10 [Dentiscutata erythropus]